MLTKLILLFLVWGAAFLFSAVLRVLGNDHPDPFLIRYSIVGVLLFLPSLLLGLWIWVVGFLKLQ